MNQDEILCTCKGSGGVGTVGGPTIEFGQILELSKNFIRRAPICLMYDLRNQVTMQHLFYFSTYLDPSVMLLMFREGTEYATTVNRSSKLKLLDHSFKIIYIKFRRQEHQPLQFQLQSTCLLICPSVLPIRHVRPLWRTIKE